MDRKTKTLTSIIVLAVLVGYLTFSGMGNTANKYIEIQQLKAGEYEGQMVYVNGTVVNNTLSWDPENMELRFKMTDNSDTVDVYYKGNLPNSIRGDIPVVVQGQYSEGLVTAKSILVKCPSKYEADIEQ